MLRVRPLILTPHFDATVTQLRELGLDTLEIGSDCADFDSGNDKVREIRESTQASRTELAFELRDATIFVRRTLADGSHAELADTDNGPGAKVTAPDGFSFSLAESEDLRLPHPDTALAVTAIWRTPDTAAANKVLANIGAKFVRDLPDGGALYRAKNGGFVATAQGEVSGVELELKHGSGILTFGAGSELFLDFSAEKKRAGRG